MTRDVLVLDSPDAVATTMAARLVERLTAIQADGRVPSVVLTGGTIAKKLHRAVADAGEKVDWSRVDFWFGDERYVPADDPERNAGQAAETMLDRLPVDPARVHVMPASDGEFGDDVEAAAAAYAAELGGTTFDVLMLGMGPDGHCASLFPGHPALDLTGSVVAVHGSPKPPPVRISLTMDTLGRADEVWFVASGAEKAPAVRDALADGADVRAVPAAGPRGRRHTQWFVDEAAASLLPR
jgi:6-phosphogluconolactonase